MTVTEDEIQERWNANIQAVQDAKQAVLASFRRYNRVRERCANAARRRDPRFPVLSAEEQADMDRTREDWDGSKQLLVEAQETFKGGVVE